jgi:5-methyltetrahydropteroyltriglutamate--homocysteine methyltransferase
MSLLATCLGHPRMGVGRELKKALEAFWAGKIPAEALETTAKELRRLNWSLMKAAGIDHIPTNDFSLYDHVLDAAVLVGAVPGRYAEIGEPLKRYFAMARGLQDSHDRVDVPALEMTKWFDTNYHYIVPEIELGQTFRLDATKILTEIDEARAIGVEPRPVLVGPVTFLRLSKLAPGAPIHATTLNALDRLIPVYEELLAVLAAKGVAWVQLDEPCLVLDLDRHAREAYRRTFQRLSFGTQRPKLMMATYFGALDENLDLALRSGFEALHIDLIRAPEQLEAVLTGLESSMQLSVGVIDGRNIWRADLDRAQFLVRRAVQAIGAERVMVAPSCSLLHVPVDLDREQKLDPELRTWLAFAKQKVRELRAIADEAIRPEPTEPLFEETRTALAARRKSPKTRNLTVRARAQAVTPSLLTRGSFFDERAKKQHARFGLPPLPTTTIGSFPQTGDVRGARASWRAGTLGERDYDAFLKEETRKCVERQEALGLDVLVHGEFERNDMVEYFGEQLEGFAFTENGWVQSYGSRCVKPPVLFGDVSRPQSMTVDWSRYAASLTKKPMKGMLTGPVTILQWSFVRDDQPRAETCMQIALALRDEVSDLEAAGIGMIQVDEPAIREGLPLRRRDYEAYLRWAVDAFRLATAGVVDETQIHTHMCYSEFGDILSAIAEMDADVLSIETSRSKMELLSDFGRFRYPNEVGPGIYDIHSPRVPTIEEMEDLLRRAAMVLPVKQLWVNPDCGLKTRGWAEVESALRNMVEAARRSRERLAGSGS